MMFMIPMPPTSRLTPAMAPSEQICHRLRVALATPMVAAISAMSRTLKSSSPLRPVPALAQEPIRYWLWTRTVERPAFRPPSEDGADSVLPAMRRW